MQRLELHLAQRRIDRGHSAATQPCGEPPVAAVAIVQIAQVAEDLAAVAAQLDVQPYLSQLALVAQVLETGDRVTHDQEVVLATVQAKAGRERGAGHRPPSVMPPLVST